MRATLRVAQVTSRLDDDGEEVEGYPLTVTVGLRVGERLVAVTRTRLSGLRVNGQEYPGELVCSGGELVEVRQRGAGWEIAVAEEDE